MIRFIITDGRPWYKQVVSGCFVIFPQFFTSMMLAMLVFLVLAVALACAFAFIAERGWSLAILGMGVFGFFCAIIVCYCAIEERLTKWSMSNNKQNEGE